MPHLVETLAYNSVRGMPWHGLGTSFKPGTITTWDEMRLAAGLMWDLDIVPISAPPLDHTDTDDEDNTKNTPVPGWKLIRRDDNGFPLYCARDTYTPIHHHEMGDILTALTEAAGTNALEFDTAGSLDEGRKVFATVALGEEFFIGDDPSPQQRFIALLNAHDGTAACKVIETTVRIVCANTWHFADVDASGRGACYSFKHTENWRARLESAREALNIAETEHAATRAELEALTKIPFTDEQHTAFIDAFVPVTDLMSPISKRNAEADRDKLRFVLSPENPALEGVYNTAYGAVQAAGEYLDHYRKYRTPDTYVTRTLLSANDGKRLATRLAINIAENKIGRKTLVAVP